MDDVRYCDCEACRKRHSESKEQTERTNEPTRSPQKPVVQLVATFDAAQLAQVVQGIMESPDHKALPVQSAADLLRHLMEFAVLEELHAVRQRRRCLSGELYTSPDFYTGRQSGMTILIGELHRIMQENSLQVEQEAKRDAAD